MVKINLNYRQTKSTQGYGFEVGEHVFVDGRNGEFVVVDIDRGSQTLQLLPVGRVGRIELISAARVRIVMPPKSSPRSKEEVDIDIHGDSTAA